MQNFKSHIENLKHLLWVWIAFFALSPCAVKEVIFSVVNAEYTKPLNKTKTTAPTSSCQYSQIDNQQVSITQQSKIKKQTEPAEITSNRFFVIRNSGINVNYSKTFSGNSPPKYILYKRLKLHVA
jgi:hypothetical protein